MNLKLTIAVRKKRTGKNLTLNPSKLDIYQEILRPPPPRHPIQSLKFFPQFVSSTKIMADADFYLPDDLWERICTFLNDEDGKDNNCYLKSVSLVSKKFPAITNGIRFSLTIRKETRPFLTPIFHRFPNLTSLDLSRFRGNYKVDRNTLLTEISCYPLNITSLNLANSALIPLNGLRAFSQNTTTLTSLNCSYKDSISTTDLLLISDCFPLLEELHLSKPAIFRGDFLNGMETLSLALPKLRKVNLSRHAYLNDQLLFQLFNNWKLLEEVIIFDCTGITDDGIASALHVRPTLRSLSFHNFFKSDNISTLFALIKSCTSLSDIKMESPTDVTMKTAWSETL